jgi:hypothetical protein
VTGNVLGLWQFDDAECTVEGTLSQLPRKSRIYSREMGLSTISSHRGTKQLKLRPLNFCQLEDCKNSVIQRSSCWTVFFFFFYKACFHWSAYLNSQNNRIWCAENPHGMHENAVHSSKTRFSVQCLGNRLWDHCSWKRQLRQNIVKVF